MKTGKCLIKNCKVTKITSRGLCQTCYATAHKLVMDGKTSWQDLTERGLALKKERDDSLFRIAFESK